MESDSELEIESELDELLNNDDNIQVENEEAHSGVKFKLKANENSIKKEIIEKNQKTVYREKNTGKIIDPLKESKEAKQKELERINYENV